MEENNTYGNKMFEDAYNSVKSRHSKYSSESKKRLFVAYAFKIIAVIGGIVLTTGVPEGVAQVIGISISIVIAIDLIFSNHKRLLITTKASKGLGLFIEDVQFQYNKSIQIIMNHRDSGRGKLAKESHDSINNEFATKCHEKSQQVKKAVDEADLKFLEALSVEKRENE